LVVGKPILDIYVHQNDAARFGGAGGREVRHSVGLRSHGTHGDWHWNVEGIAQFVAPMKNVEWVEVQPFHQMGAFKWKAMGIEYKLADTPTASRELVDRVIGQFRAAGCRVR